MLKIYFITKKFVPNKIAQVLIILIEIFHAVFFYN